MFFDAFLDYSKGPDDNRYCYCFQYPHFRFIIFNIIIIIIIIIIMITMTIKMIMITTMMSIMITALMLMTTMMMTTIRVKMTKTIIMIMIVTTLMLIVAMVATIMLRVDMVTTMMKTVTMLGPVSRKSRNFSGAPLCISKTKASRGTTLCPYIHLHSLYNMWKDQLYGISRLEFYEWLFEPEKLSGLWRNGPLITWLNNWTNSSRVKLLTFTNYRMSNLISRELKAFTLPEKGKGWQFKANLIK